MRYVDQVVQPGETIRHVTTLSWVTFLPGLCLWIVALVPFAYARSGELAGGIAMVAIGLLFAAGAFLLARAWWRRWTTEIAVTDRRIIYVRGFIRRRTVEINMDKVESVDVEQSILGRILSYGDINIRGIGETVEPLRDIDHPLQFRNHVTAA